MSDKILVTGATGHLGRELVAKLVAAGAAVKAGTRNPDRARALFGETAEVVHLDFDVTETWDAAVQWADRVFLVPPPFDPHADDRLVPFLDWAVQSGSSHIVLLSAMGVEARQQLALRRVERRIERTGVAWTFLRPNIFMQNFSRGFVARSIRDHGTFRLSAGHGAVSFVDARDVADAAVVVLAGGPSEGKAYTLTGSRAIDHDRVAEIIGDVADRDVRYDPVDDEAMTAMLVDDGWPRDQAETFTALLASIRDGDRAAVSSDLDSLLGRVPIAFETFASDCADTWR